MKPLNPNDKERRVHYNNLNLQQVEQFIDDHNLPPRWSLDKSCCCIGEPTSPDPRHPVLIRDNGRPECDCVYWQRIKLMNSCEAGKHDLYLETENRGYDGFRAIWKHIKCSKCNYIKHTLEPEYIDETP